MLNAAVFPFMGGMHTLPRRDRTFTDADLLRFWALNLDRQERENVLSVFRFLTFVEDTDDQTFIRFFGSVAGLVPILGDAVEISLEIFLAAQNLRRTIDLGLIADEVSERSGFTREQIIAIYRNLMRPEANGGGGPPPEGLE